MSDVKKTSVSEGRNRRRQPGELPTRKNAIRLHCLECCGWNNAEVRRCTAKKCWLWPYRMSIAEKDAVLSEIADNGENNNE